MKKKYVLLTKFQKVYQIIISLQYIIDLEHFIKF